MEKKYKLPEDFATKWVEALRSGEYKQGFGAFYEPEGNCYCGLGVGFKVNNIKVDSYTIISGWPDFMPINLKGEILSLNDEQKKSLTEIADWIEENCQFV